VSGLQASSQNNLQHGFASMFRILPGEDHPAFEKLLADFTAEWNPATPTETARVLSAAQFNWMSDRAMRLQMRSMDDALAPGASNLEPIGFERMLRYHTQFDRAFHRALNSSMKLQVARQKEQIGP
jgi:hypothetical protein